MTGETTWPDTMVVSGGTGRFESATGEVTETGRVDMGTGQVWMVGEGWIACTPGN